MGQKDIAEKALEAYNDVFSDIINTLIFEGEQGISADDLADGGILSQYKADGKLHGQERDVAKYWQDGLLRLAFLGFENQSGTDADMALRAIGYNGAAYRAQLLSDEEITENGKKRVIQKPRYPVFTFVLYFGTRRHWRSPRTLRERLGVSIPAKLEPYFHDYGINVFEIAWLTDEQVNMFQSDFGIVADYFVQLRKKQDYVPPNRTIKHVHELLQLLSVMRNDRRFEDIYNEKMEREDTTMCEVLDKIEARGQKKGEAIGEARGEARGLKKGEIKILSDLVNDGTLSIAQAAAKKSISVESFVAQCKRYNYRLNAPATE